MIPDKIKKAFASLQSFFSIPEKAWISQMRGTAPLIRVLARLTQDFHDAYMQKKQEEGILEFSDTEHYALTLLVDQEASGFTDSRAQYSSFHNCPGTSKELYRSND